MDAEETKIKPNLKNIYQKRVEGLSDKLIARYLGMTAGQFEYALNNYAPLKEVYDSAMTLLFSKLTNVVVERALGLDKKKDKDGNEVGPDANLSLRLLEKLDPRFKDTKEVNVNIRIEDVIRSIADKRKQEAIDADFSAKETIAHEQE